MDDLDENGFAQRIASRKSLSAECFEWLKQQILSGRFSLGTYIREKHVESSIGISRSPIREAFVRLAEFGLGEYVPNRGFRVVTFDSRRVEEVGQVRLALENLSVRLAADKATDEQVAQLGELLTETQRRLAGGADEYPPDLDLHGAVLNLADNGTLTEMLDRIDATVRAIRTLGGGSPQRPWEALAEHRAIHEAVADRDPEGAVRAMTRHIDKSNGAMLERVRQQEPR